MPVTNYYTVDGEIIGEQTTGSPRVDYLTDALGNVTATVDQTGTVINRYTYKPYGGLLTRSGAGVDPAFQWVGNQGYKQTGKRYSDVYVRARHYDTSDGRWTTKDPIGFAGGMWSLYPYVRANPNTRIDPSGLTVGCNFSKQPVTNLLFACLLTANCSDTCTKWQQDPSLKVYPDAFKRPNFNFAPGSPDCPTQGSQEWNDLIYWCDFDHGKKSGGATQASTCCCKNCQGDPMAGNCQAYACTEFEPSYFKLPKIYQTVIWDHEQERRRCCFDTCCGKLDTHHWQAQIQWDVWGDLLSCFTDWDWVRQNLSACEPGPGVGFPGKPTCLYTNPQKALDADQDNYDCPAAQSDYPPGSL